MVPPTKKARAARAMHSDSVATEAQSPGRTSNQSRPSTRNTLVAQPKNAVVPTTVGCQGSVTPFTALMSPFNMEGGSQPETPLNQKQSPEATVPDSISKLSTQSTSTEIRTEWLADTSPLETAFERCRVRLDSYVRGVFFDKCKFISAQIVDKWNDSPNALCLKICKDMNVSLGLYQKFWETHANYINSTLNNRRNDVRTKIKKDFMSK